MQSRNTPLEQIAALVDGVIDAQIQDRILRDQDCRKYLGSCYNTYPVIRGMAGTQATAAPVIDFYVDFWHIRS